MFLYEDNFNNGYKPTIIGLNPKCNTLQKSKQYICRQMTCNILQQTFNTVQYQLIMISFRLKRLFTYIKYNTKKVNWIPLCLN